MENRKPNQKGIYRIRDYLFSALFPQRCHLCGERFNPPYSRLGESVFFGEEPIKSPLCPDCTEALCALYRPKKRQIDENTVYRWLFDYNEETVQKLIFHIKFHRCDECLAFVGKTAAAAIAHRCQKIRAVIAVPRSVPLMKRYGFDQSARMLEQYKSVPNGAPILDVLYRDPRFSVQQKGLTASERRENAFRSLRLKEHAVVPKCVCVFDDIVTTGSTALAAAALLRKAGAEKIDFLFLASAQRLR